MQGLLTIVHQEEDDVRPFGLGGGGDQGGGAEEESEGEQGGEGSHHGSITEAGRGFWQGDCLVEPDNPASFRFRLWQAVPS